MSELGKSYAISTNSSNNVEYMKGLLEEFREVRREQESVLKKSMQLIQKIQNVAVIFLPSQFDGNGNDNRIEKLIEKFEKIKDGDVTPQAKIEVAHASAADADESKSKINVKQITNAFVQIGRSAMLLEGFVLFKRAHDMLAECDNYFEKLCATNDASSLCNASLKEKIQMFNQYAHVERNSNYTSCCSSVESIPEFQSVSDFEEFHQKLVVKLNRNEIGYDGDTEYESESDLKIKSE